MTTTTLRIGIAPSKDNPDLRRYQVTRDGLTVARRDPHLLFTTEMGDGGRDRNDFLKGLGGPGQYGVFSETGRTPNPIFFDRDRIKQGPSSHHAVAVPGYVGDRRWYWPGVSGTRSYEVATVIPRSAKGRALPELAFVAIGAHLPAFAWSDRLDDEPDKQRWVRALWCEMHAEIEDEIADQHRAGYTVLVGADWNRDVDRIATFAPGQRWLINGGIDGVLLVPAPKRKGPKVSKLGGVRVVDQPGGDHHYRDRLIVLRRGGRAA